MGIVRTYFHFPDEAASACRTVPGFGRADLPSRMFVFMEAYCIEPQCDCRRVILNMIEPKRTTTTPMN
jgi:hypothetical protein